MNEFRKLNIENMLEEFKPKFEGIGFAGVVRRMFEDVGIIPEELTESQRFVMSAFVYGMWVELRRYQGLEWRDEFEGVMIGVFVEVLKYGKKLAKAQYEGLDDAWTHRGSELLKRTIRQGIKGHRQWSDGKISVLKANITRVFTQARIPAPWAPLVAKEIRGA